MLNSYSEALAKLPIDAKWRCSFGYPGNGGFVEYYRDANGNEYSITNGPWYAGDEWNVEIKQFAQ
jgi:hypothetical protein